jgi:chemotaxis protein MotB
VIRIELPADRLFGPGSAQLQTGAYPLLDQAAAAIARDYSRQIVGIEGHTDSGPVSGGYATAHQLTAAQTMVVFDQLTRRSRFSERQLFTLAHGANHPLASNATPAGRAKNRRIELVVYPETVDGR